MSTHDDPLFGPAEFDVPTTAPGPTGSLPLTDEMLRERPSGDLFGLSQNAGMGWNPDAMLGPEVLLLSTQGGIRAADGKPVALGYHTGHWEVGLLMQEAADIVRKAGGTPFAGFVSDPCDGRTQGTTGMFDSLPYRNDAAIVLRRLIRSLPTRKGVVGVATCDKGLPAMMIALAGCGDLPGVIVPGGVTLPPAVGEDAGKVQTIGARYSVGELSLEDAAALGCRACATPGGGCQFLGTAATAQVVAEALGMSVPHAALAPSGQPIWRDVARRSAQAVLRMIRKGTALRDVLTDAAVRNAMTVHAAFGGSTNLLLHVPAVAHAAKLQRPTIEQWSDTNRRTPRLVDALPNGPIGHPTVRVFLAGGVPEVLVHLRELGLLELDAATATDEKLDAVIDKWRTSERRKRLREQLHRRDGIDPDDVILPPARAAERGLTPTVCFPRGNLCPDGAVVKSTAIDKSVIDADGVYRHAGPAKVFTTEPAAIEAIKTGKVVAGDVIALIGRGPIGCGMEECYQVTGALKHVSFGKHVALITDARFSGVSTGACVGHVGPEALAGGPIGKLRDGDVIRLHIDTKQLTGSVDVLDDAVLQRAAHPDLRPDANIPDDTRLWAALQQLGGGTWGGCVYDVDAILAKLNA